MRDLSYWLGEDGHSHRPPMDKRKAFREGRGDAYYGPSLPRPSIIVRITDWWDALPTWCIGFVVGMVVASLMIGALIVGYAR